MDIEKLHREVMDRLNSSSFIMGGEITMGDSDITEHTVYNYISMAICNGVDTYTVEELVRGHSKLSPERILNVIERYMDKEGVAKRSEPVKEAKPRGRKPKPVVYEGKVYPSPQALADSLGIRLKIVRYWIDRGVAVYKG